MILNPNEKKKFQAKRAAAITKMASNFNPDWTDQEVFVFVSSIQRLAAQIFEASKYSIPENWTFDTLELPHFISIKEKDKYKRHRGVVPNE